MTVSISKTSVRRKFEQREIIHNRHIGGEVALFKKELLLALRSGLMVGASSTAITTVTNTAASKKQKKRATL